MAQFTNYAALPVQKPDYSGYDNILQNFMQGYQTAAAPRQMQEQAKLQALQKQALMNQLKQDPYKLESMQRQNEFQALQNENYPTEQAARLALLNAQTNKAGQSPSQNQKLSGDAQNAFAVEELANQLGEDDPRVKAARKALEEQGNYRKSLTDYRTQYANTVDKRSATGLGKQGLELEDIRAGFQPGTGRAVKLTPEDQEALENRYNLSIQKATTDSDTRKKSLFAANIDKTIAMINPDDLLQYSGLKGGVAKAGQAGLASIGKESENYDNYRKAKQAADLLASQVRQFYGDSIQPSMVERLEKLTNPESWSDSPKLAKKNLEAIQNILKQETGTYRASLKGTQPYEEPPRNSSSADGSQGTVTLYKNGIPHNIPKKDADDAMKNYGYSYAK